MLVAPLAHVAPVCWHVFACALAALWVLVVYYLFAFVCFCSRGALECWWHRGECKRSFCWHVRCRRVTGVWGAGGTAGNVLYSPLLHARWLCGGGVVE